MNSIKAMYRLVNGYCMTNEEFKNNEDGTPFYWYYKLGSFYNSKHNELKLENVLHLMNERYKEGWHEI